MLEVGVDRGTQIVVHDDDAIRRCGDVSWSTKMEDVIRFSIAGIPVRVRLSFWIVAGLLGLGLGDGRLVAGWVAIVFVSVLVHEMGHAVMARRYGAEASVELNTLGGLTSWRSNDGEMAPRRRALVAAAGSAAGIVLGLTVLGVYQLLDPSGGMTGVVVAMIAWVNVGWGVLNWLPIRMLDGGHLVVSLLDIVAPRRADRIADGVFLVTALAGLGAAVYFRHVFVVVLAAFVLMVEVGRHVGSDRPSSSPPMRMEIRPSTDPSDDSP